MSPTKTDENSWDEVFSAISGDARVAEYRASVNAIAESTITTDPFRVLVATVISLRTRDEVTLTASQKLFQHAHTPEALAAMPTDRVAELLYPAGFYRTKAVNLQKISRILLDHYDGLVPPDLNDLITLPGVGRKTANLVLSIGFGIPAICVDTHVHRVANRTGWVATTDPDKTETALARILPTRYWIPINALMVAFGREVCTPRTPSCSTCPVQKKCDRVGVTRSR